jgi:tellurium resistance protein TerD
MAVSLTKGGNVSLEKVSPGIKNIMVGLGWDPRGTVGQQFDLDGAILLLGDNGKVVNDDHFVFYNNKTSPCGAVVHAGDNRDGAGNGDDETVNVALDRVAPGVQKIVFAVSIHDAAARKQTFGQVNNAKIRIVNIETGTELVRFDLSEDSSVESSMIFGELYRHGFEWKFKAVAQGFAGGLAELIKSYGVST